MMMMMMMMMMIIIIIIIIIKFTHVTARNILSIRKKSFYTLLHILPATRLLI